MPVLLGCLSLFVPRLVVLILWFFTSWFQGMFPTRLWPILGFFFLPTTLLWYSAVQRWFGGQWTLWPVVGLVVALLLDVGSGRGRWSTPSSPRCEKGARRPAHA
ncbi:hypothetical protein [Hyalangium gracile]|uniref:hypothetical protein n=1 Tax=Hyalangium gracile TaxID=394092 RepID=UPI001CCBF280|nr:hypothetical protein [Hyalangium gracile]